MLLHQMGSDAPEQQRDWIERSSHRIADMLKIIDDWLTFSKVEGGQLATAREPVSWSDTVARALDELGPAARQEERDTTQRAAGGSAAGHW